MKIKTGLGFDVHRLAEGRILYLGGVEIPFSKGLIGHSDGDCLIHAIIDALLGAVGEKDIGQHFPDTDPQYEGIRSTELLETTTSLLREKGAEILNIDSIVLAEKPVLGPHIPRMKETLSAILGLREDDLGIKAKTNEGMGLVGQGDVIAAWASVLIKLNSSLK